MDAFLRQELVEAGLRLRDAISRVVTESPECISHRNDNWSFEFRNPATGEGIVVTYAGPRIPLRQN
jgi:hypothetical protein